MEGGSLILFELLVFIYLVIILLAVVVWTCYQNGRNYWKRAFEPLKPCQFQRVGNMQRIKKVMNSPSSPPEGYISYSLYGNYPRYVERLLLNIPITKKYLPTWCTRVYVAPDIPDEVLDRLLRCGAEVVMMNQVPIGLQGSCWRFLAAADSVRFLTFDADNEFGAMEAADIREWVKSGRQFYLANPYRYAVPLDAGRWGAAPSTVNGIKTPAIPDMMELLDKYCDHSFGFDEHFLRSEVFPRILQSGDFYQIERAPFQALTVILLVIFVAVVAYSLILAWRLKYVPTC